MKNIIRSIMLVLALCILWGATGQTAEAAKKAKIKVTLKKGVLTIAGKGAVSAKPKVKNKKKVKKVVVKKGITSIPDYAFSDFKNLKEAVLPSGLQKIGCYSFVGTAISNLTVPTSVKTIGQSAFRCSKKMKKLTLPGNFKLITRKGEDAEYTIADKVETVAFNTELKLNTTTMFCSDNLLVHSKDPRYKSIGGVVYSKDGKSIVRVPFARKELVLEAGCEEFCLQSILYCSMDVENEPVHFSKLGKIVIPASVKRIETEKYPAKYTNSVESDLSVELQTNQLNGDSLALLVSELRMKPGEIMNRMPDFIDCAEDLYITKDGVLLGYSGNAEEIQIPVHVRKIGANVFRNKNLRKVVLPEGLTEIGASAFSLDVDEEKFVSLEVNLPATLTRVGDYAFYRRHMKELVLPSSVKSYGKACFADNDFAAVKLPDGLKVIPERMFTYCEKLKKIVIPDSVETIEREAFANCSQLRNVELGKGIKKVDEYAFSNTAVKKAVIHGSGKAIANWAFVCHGVEMDYTKAIKERKTMFAVWSITRVSDTKQEVRLFWNTVTGADGYQIVLAKDAGMKKGKKTIDIKGNKSSRRVLLPIKRKTTEPVYGKIRPYKKVKGKKVYGKWTKDSMAFE